MSEFTPDLSLLLSFDTSGGEFARGFEVGRLWANLRGDPTTTLSEYVHASNLEMLLRIGEATGRPVLTEDVDETWVVATFGVSSCIDSD
jgi:hypothetical protein